MQIEYLADFASMHPKILLSGNSQTQQPLLKRHQLFMT